MEDLYPTSGFAILLAQANLKSQQTFLHRSYEHHAALRPIEPCNYACIGMDTSLAKFFLESVFDPLMGVKETLRLGVWATSLSKVHSSGVSGPTVAFSYKKGDSEWERHFSGEIAEIEEKFPMAELYGLVRKYWIDRNPDIWKIADGTEIRSVDY